MALTIDGSDPTGDLGDLLDAKLPIAGGKILQIVRATDATDRTTNSASFIDASLSVTITPQKIDSILLIIYTGSGVAQSGDDTMSSAVQITNSGDTALSGAQTGSFGLSNLTGTSTREFRTTLAMIGRVAPATLSAVTYKLRFRGGGGTRTTLLLNSTFYTGQLYAIEVSA